MHDARVRLQIWSRLWEYLVNVLPQKVAGPAQATFYLPPRLSIFSLCISCFAVTLNKLR